MFAGYEADQNEDKRAVDCAAGRCPTGQKVCQFHFSKLGEECVKQKNYGYNTGKPCILLLLKPVSIFLSNYKI